MADSHHVTVVQRALQVAGGVAGDRPPLRLGVGMAGAHHRFGEVERLCQPSLQVEVEARWDIDVDLHYAGGPSPVEQPLHLWSGHPELAGDLALRPPVDQ